MVAPGNAKSSGSGSGVDRLRESAAQASQVRALSTHPDVIALRVESIRTQVDVLMWVGIVLGLAFTMVNVQAFAAAGAVTWSLPWIAAWLLDPMVSLVLIAVLRAEQITARYQVSDATGWLTRTKRFAFAATYVMNTWHSFIDRDVAGIVLHSVPPLLVFCAAETAPVLRERLTEAVLRAERTAADANPTAQPLTELAAATLPPALESDSAATATADAGTATPETPKRPARKAPARRPAAKRGGKTTGKDKAQAHWVVETAAGREPSGAELARVAGVDASLGRRWAKAWRYEAPYSHAPAADITPAAPTDTPDAIDIPETDSTDRIEGEAA
nr:hypothetical protein [Kribbella italica]